MELLVPLDCPISPRPNMPAKDCPWGMIVWYNCSCATIGAWFDAASDALILDQRALWVFVLLTLVLKGAGPLSLDRVLAVWRRGDRGN